jgi:hypothetical protein
MCAAQRRSRQARALMPNSLIPAPKFGVPWPAGGRRAFIRCQRNRPSVSPRCEAREDLRTAVGDRIGAQKSPTVFCAPMFSPQRNFFFFLVRRNSANFASARSRKSFADGWLACGGEAKLSEFRLGGATKIVPGEALFVTAGTRERDRHIWLRKMNQSCSVRVFAHGESAIGETRLPGSDAQNSLPWVLRI